MTTVGVAEPPSIERPEVTEVEPRKARPVLWWATFGGICIVLTVYLWAAWIIQGDYKTVPTGKTPVPDYMHINIRAQEVLGVIILAGLIYWYLIRPFMPGHDRKISWDGLFLIGAASVYWQDAFINFTQYNYVYNADVINGGSWFCRVPGWNSPNACRMVEAPLWGGIWYTYGLLWAAILGCWFMRLAKKRWPRMGTVGLIGFCFLVWAAIDIVMEIFYLIGGFYAYPGAIKGVTLFYGHYYQFPLYEALFWGSCWAFMICLRYFKNDRGESVCERGIDRVRVGTKTKTFIRCLAICGALNMLFLVFYQLPINLTQAMHSSTWPADIQKRSYFTQGLCGAGTTYACPGPGIPIPRPGSIHIDPNGKVVVPAGVKTPKEVPLDTK